MVKIDISTGLKIWKKIYGNNENDEFNRIKITSDGNFTIAGNTSSYGDTNGDFWFFKVNTLGDSLTSGIIAATLKKETCYDFIEDKANHLIFCGAKDTSYHDIGKTISFALKTDLNGNYLDRLENTGGQSDEDRFNSIANSTNGNKYCFARKVNRPGYKAEISPFLTDFNFHYMVAPTYGGTMQEESYRIVNTKDNGYAVIGTTTSFGNGNINVFLLKTDSTIISSTNITGLEESKSFQSDRKAYYFNENIYFNTANEHRTCKLYNYSGMLIEEGESDNNSYIIKTPVAKGIYILSYSTEKTIENLKFIIE